MEIADTAGNSIADTVPTAIMDTSAGSGGGATPWLYARRRSQVIGAGGIT